jgi:hypothetical protein
MVAEVDFDPDQCPSTIFVGQDRAGHWLVQESTGLMEGRFISREAAMQFALAERHGFPGAQILLAVHPLVSSVSFDRVRPEDHALAHAA